jgi:hypothetical protein
MAVTTTPGRTPARGRTQPVAGADPSRVLVVCAVIAYLVQSLDWMSCHAPVCTPGQTARNWSTPVE